MENSEMDKNVSEILNKLMLDNELSANELADKVGLTQSTISRLLNKAIKNQEMNTLKPIAQYFDLTISELIGEVPFNQKSDEPIIIVDKHEIELINVYRSSTEYGKRLFKVAIETCLRDYAKGIKKAISSE